MKAATSRMKSALKAHALDWITVVLAATAVAMFVLAVARAASAAPAAYGFDADGHGPERPAGIETAEIDLQRRLAEVAFEFRSYVANLEHGFERRLASLEHDVSEVVEGYACGGTRREFDRSRKSLEIRLDQLARRIHLMATAAGQPRSGGPF